MNNKHTENILVFLLGFVLSLLLGIFLKDNMKRESLQGYKAVATYETNTVGEVKIKNIEWRKP